MYNFSIKNQTELITKSDSVNMCIDILEVSEYICNSKRICRSGFTTYISYIIHGSYQLLEISSVNC